MDSGATRTVCGEAIWDKLNGYLNMRGMEMEAEITKDPRDFRFGDGVTVRSHFCARTPVCVGKVWRDLVIHVLPGHTPLLLARPDLEKWNVMVNYGKKMVYVDGIEIKPIISPNGHYMINIYDDLNNILQVEDLYYKSAVSDKTGPRCFWTRWFPMTSLTLSWTWKSTSTMTWSTTWCIYGVVEKSRIHQRTLRFLGSLRRRGQTGQIPHGDLSWCGGVSVLSSKVELRRSWSSARLREAQRDFRKLAAHERPHHVMMAPECRLWSPMQNLNYRTPERRALLQDLRNLEEETRLKFYADVHADSKKIYYDCTLEQPADAASWLTPTLEKIKGYFETVLHRCRTGLRASPDDPRFVRKPTKFRSTSKKVCVAVNLRCQCDIGRSWSQGHAELRAWPGSALGWCDLWVHGRDLEGSRSSWTHDAGTRGALQRGDAVPWTEQGAGEDRWTRSPQVSGAFASTTWTSQWIEADLCQDQAHSALQKRGGQRKGENHFSSRPSIEDYLTQDQTDKINGDMDAPSVPIHPDEWDGIGRAQREAMISVHEDALLLGLDFEEMDGNLVKEAHRIRAELNHIRSLGREVNFLRMPRIGFFFQLWAAQ